jgi:hypothetical protein
VGRIEECTSLAKQNRIFAELQPASDDDDNDDDDDDIDTESGSDDEINRIKARSLCPDQIAPFSTRLRI